MSTPKEPYILIKNTFYGKPMWLCLFLGKGKEIIISKPNNQKSITVKTLFKKLHKHIKTNNP